MASFVEFTSANGGFPVHINPDAVVSVEPSGHGTAILLITRETVRVSEPIETAIALLSAAAPAAPAAAAREKK